MRRELEGSSNEVLMLARALAFTAVFAAASIPVAAQPATRETIRRQVDAQTRLMSAAFARGNMVDVARFYADDATIYSPSGEITEGRRALDRFWQKVRHPHSWTLETLDVGGSIDEPWQLVESTLVTRDGSHRSVDRVTCLLIWKRGADGRLRIHVDMFTPLRDE